MTRYTLKTRLLTTTERKSLSCRAMVAVAVSLGVKYRYPLAGRPVAHSHRQRRLDDAKLSCTTGRFLAQEIVFTSNESFAIANMNGTTSVGMKLDSLASVLVGLSSVIIRGDYNEWSNGAAARSTQKTGLSSHLSPD